MAGAVQRKPNIYRTPLSMQLSYCGDAKERRYIHPVASLERDQGAGDREPRTRLPAIAQEWRNG